MELGETSQGFQRQEPSFHGITEALRLEKVIQSNHSPSVPTDHIEDTHQPPSVGEGTAGAPNTACNSLGKAEDCIYFYMQSICVSLFYEMG